jgi:RNA polymerase sigma-70 factor (ECF subfamily)
MRARANTVDDRTESGKGDPASHLRALVAEYGPALQRLARGYEADPARQQDLVQDVLVALWTALPAFEGRSSERTWLYRIAHNVAASHVVKRRRDQLARAVPVDDEALSAVARDAAREMEGRDQVHRLAVLVRALRPADAQLVLLYLEGLTHLEIAEITGLSVENVAVKVHRIKTALTRALQEDPR